MQRATLGQTCKALTSAHCFSLGLSSSHSKCSEGQAYPKKRLVAGPSELFSEGFEAAPLRCPQGRKGAL